MTRSARELGSYPASFLNLASMFEGPTALRSITVDCESETAARRMRFDLYAFKGTIDRLKQRGDYQNFMATRIYVSGYQLTIKHADDTARALDAALEHAKRLNLSAGTSVEPSTR